MFVVCKYLVTQLVHKLVKAQVDLHKMTIYIFYPKYNKTKREGSGRLWETKVKNFSMMSKNQGFFKELMTIFFKQEKINLLLQEQNSVDLSRSRKKTGPA